MHFHPFVLPFSFGLAFIFIYFIIKIIIWIRRLSSEDRNRIKNSVFTLKTWEAVKEVFWESLLHRKVFRINPLLGYMHASIAFGWFLLIVVGNLESRLYHPADLNPPYYPIFLGFFDRNSQNIFWFSGIFKFSMNLLLLIIISGVILALIKRMRAGVFNMKKTTKLKLVDKIPLYALWLIFPLRFLAESLSAGFYHNGGFATNYAGAFLSHFIPEKPFVVLFYWAYSISLSVFFVSLPWSRYMHIPTEVILIFFRNYGIRDVVSQPVLQEIEVLSCSRCGLCIDTCQMMSSLRVNQVQAVYFLRNVRENQKDRNKAFNCLMCGRCTEKCPVGISVNDQRLVERHLMNQYCDISNGSYFGQYSGRKGSVAYFAGCMTHLTPTIKKAMTEIFNQAGIDWVFMDERESLCCGRPARLAGLFAKALAIQEELTEKIIATGAKCLVTSCPICLKTFREDYHLPIPVEHHTVFINKLLKERRLKLKRMDLNAIYHDPCELGRGLNIYEEPREILSSVLDLKSQPDEKENALCCGGSLGGFCLSGYEKNIITRDALEKMNVTQADILATACPLCKKTFASSTKSKVMDIAEVVAMSMEKQEEKCCEKINDPVEMEQLQTVCQLS